MEFFGVFLGAFLGALLGWYALYKENERVEFRQANFAALDGLADLAQKYVDLGFKEGPEDADYLAGRALHLGQRYIEGIEQHFDAAERSALSKWATELSATVRELCLASERQEMADIFDRWSTRHMDQLRVLRRAVDDASKPGVRSLLRSYR